MSRFQQAQTKHYFGFNPLSIGVCSLWLDAADSNTITLSGSNVSTWRDKSGNKNDASGTVLPTYSNNAVVFDGATQYLTTNYTAGSEDESVFIVSYLDTASYANFPTLINASGNGGRQLFITSTGAFQVNVQNLTNGPNGGIAPTFQNALYSYRSSNMGTSNNIQLWINGSSVNAGATLGLFSNSTSWIGAWPGGNYWQGRIFEILAFSQPFLPGQREQVEGYLAKKWGVTLPASHEYSAGAPYMRAFVPTDLLGCTNWLDAMDTNTLVFSGSNVVQWRDKSGSGFDASAALANAPTWSNNQIVIPDGNTSWMTSALRVSNNQHTLFTVYNPINDVSLNNRVFSFQGTGGTGAVVFPFTQSGVRPRGYTNTSSTWFTVSNSLLREFGIAGQLNLACANLSFSNARVFKSGELQTIADTGAGGGVSPTLYIGSGRPTRSTEVFGGTIGEMIVYERSLQDYERRQVEGYLAKKWDILPTLPGNSSFNVVPTDLCGCVMWLDAADSATVTVSGSMVINWADKSGSRNDASGGVPPTYVSNAVNGYNAISFNGTNTFLRSADLYSGRRSFMINMVFRRNANITVQSGLISSQNYNNGNNMHISFPTNATTIQFAVFGSAIVYSSFPAYTSNDPPFLITGVYTPYNRRMYINGNFVAGDSNSTGVNLHTNGVIGRFSNSFFNGHICEILVYNNVVATDPFRKKVEGYLTTKWKISNIQEYHPFQTAAIPATPPFSPRHISNCVFWIDAADPTAFTSNENSIVTQVKDKSSFGRNLSNTMTTSGFTWNQTKFNNAYPSFYYNSTQNVRLGSNSATSFGTAVTIFSVHDRVTTSANQYIFDVSGAVRFSLYYTTSIPNGIRLFSGITQGIYATQSNGAVFQSINLSNIAADLWENGTAIATANTGALNCSNGITVGSAFTPTPSSTFQGHIAELLVFSRNLSVTERQRIEGYLAWKWGLQGKLPSTHPYKTLKLY